MATGTCGIVAEREDEDKAGVRAVGWGMENRDGSRHNIEPYPCAMLASMA